jgi:fumarate hydratase subunit beta
MQERLITTPLTKDQACQLRAGELLLINGTLYTARDASHQRLIDCMDQGIALPFSLKDQIIFYVGPTPAPPGKVIGSAGPTTAYRMDSFTPRLIKEGVSATIGKGNRSSEVIDAMKRYGAVYLAALGGGGALLSQCVKSVEIIAFPELGTEAVRKLEVENFPVVVAIDSSGTNLYERNKL